VPASCFAPTSLDIFQWATLAKKNAYIDVLSQMKSLIEIKSAK
jgi:hypothetical protein